MNFRLQSQIRSKPTEVFSFLRDKERSFMLAGRNSRVTALDKLTEGTPRIGTRYAESVQVLPFLTLRIDSELTHLETDRLIEERWWGDGMKGNLRYTLTALNGTTSLRQEQTLYCQGWLKLLTPLIYLAFWIAIRHRMNGLKKLLEAGRHD